MPDNSVNGGSDMQPEFDKNISKSPMVNYSKIISGGEVQDILRQENTNKEG